VGKIVAIPQLGGLHHGYEQLLSGSIFGEGQALVTPEAMKQDGEFSRDCHNRSFFGIPSTAFGQFEASPSTRGKAQSRKSDQRGAMTGVSLPSIAELPRPAIMSASIRLPSARAFRSWRAKGVYMAVYIRLEALHARQCRFRHVDRRDTC
jgi:hypothetical protein